MVSATVGVNAHFLQLFDLIVLEIVGESNSHTTKILMDASKELNTYYETLSKRLRVGFANADTWNIPLAFDGVHITEQGHRLFAQQLADHLTKEGMLPCFRKK